MNNFVVVCFGFGHITFVGAFVCYIYWSLVHAVVYVNFTHNLRVASLALGQTYDASQVTMKYKGKIYQ